MLHHKKCLKKFSKKWHFFVTFLFFRLFIYIIINLKLKKMINYVKVKRMIHVGENPGEHYLARLVRNQDVDLDQIIAEKETFSKSQLILDAYNKIVDTDDKKNKFRILTNTMLNLYDASKPEIFERTPKWANKKFAPLKYLHDLYTKLLLSLFLQTRYNIYQL
jgi:hypothetical protein